MIYHLIYTSHASQHFSEEELISLLKICRINNKTKSITGMLLYLQDRFIQVLEGRQNEIQNLLQTIKNDKRHHHVTVLLEGESDHRIFKDWHMGFKKLNRELFNQLSGYTDPDLFFIKHKVTNHSNPLLIFLKLFYQKNMVDHHVQDF